MYFPSRNYVFILETNLGLRMVYIIMNLRGGNEQNAEIYTELGNTVSGESENQYDCISRGDNYNDDTILF